MNKPIKKPYYSLKRKYETIRRKSFEAIGRDNYSRPSLNNIDQKLDKYLNYQNGFFIEVGANDGFSQSNTYYLEKFRSWKGILIEGIPELYQKCVRERPKSKVFNCALVSGDFQQSYVTMRYSNLMSLVKGAFENDEQEMNHIQKGIQIQKTEDITSYEIKVKTKTLTSILDECNVAKIDFFSLDVEGFELNVLKGLDFNKYRPKYMLIEARFREEIEEYISDFYSQVDQFSHHDFLYKSRVSI